MNFLELIGVCTLTILGGIAGGLVIVGFIAFTSHVFHGIQ